MDARLFRNLVVIITAIMSIRIARAQQPSARTPKIKPNLIPQEKATNPVPSASAQPKTPKEFGRERKPDSDDHPAGRLLKRASRIDQGWYGYNRFPL
jgi:hypothetical protein